MIRRDLLVAACCLAATSCRSGGKVDAPPAIMIGEATCATCGMTVEEPRFAAAIREENGVLVFDSIECLLKHLRRTGDAVPPGTWLADFEEETLYPVAAVTVVAADFPSPMGGGYAAFHDSTEAHEAASARHGVAGPLAGFASGRLAPPPKP